MRSTSIRRALLAFIAAFTFVACGGARSFTPPPRNITSKRQFSYAHKIELFRVNNGMTVAVIPDEHTNLVQVDMRYRVGAAEDPPGKAGLAHLVEHLLFEIRRDDSSPTITDRLRDKSLFYNAYTNWDSTHYTATGSADSLTALLTIERDRMAATCSQLSEELLVREREVVRQELAWRQTESLTTADILRMDFFGKGHGYHEKVGGTDAEVASLTRDDVCNFMKNYYAPDRGILVISGAVQPNSAQPVVGSMFGKVGGKALALRKQIAKPQFTGKEKHARVNIDESAVAISFAYPTWGSTDLVGVDLFTDILIERLQALKGKKHLKNVSVGIVGGKRSRAIVFVLTPDDLANRESLIPLFFKTRKAVLAGESPERFSFRTASKRTQMVRELETYTSLASRVADYLQFTKHYRFMLKEMSDLDALTVPVLAELSETDLLPTNGRITYLDPQESDKDDQAAQASIEAPSLEMDIRPWKQPVDPNEADSALSIGIKQVRTKREEFELANGLRVVLAPDFEYPTIDLRMIFPVGDSMDPVDKPGLAYWTANLIETELDDNWTANLWNRVIEVRRMGGAMSATTTSLSTIFRNRGLSMYADGLIWQLHWLLESGTVGKALNEAKKLVREGRAEQKAKKRSPSDSYYEALAGGLFGKTHPYAVVRDNVSTFLNLQASEVESFRSKNYKARGATLVVAGNFDVEAVSKQIKSLYSSWPSLGAPAKRNRVPEAAPRSAPIRSLVVDDEMKHPEITMAFSTASGVLHKRAARLVVEALVDQRVSAVRETLGASYGVQVDYGFNHGPGSLVVSGTVNRAKAAAALGLLQKNFAELRSGTGIRDDFARARRQVLKSALGNAASATNVAGQISTEASYGLEANFSSKMAADIAKLTLDEVKAQLAEDLAAHKEVLIIRGAEALGRAIFKEAGVTDFELR